MYDRTELSLPLFIEHILASHTNHCRNGGYLPGVSVSVFWVA